MLIGLYILTFYLLSKISGTIIFINPGSQECFSENVKGESLLFADFEVLSGSNFYIDAKIRNVEKGVEIYNGNKKKDERFNIKVGQGKYELCLINTDNSESKKVSFNYYYGEGFSHQEIAKKGTIDPLLKDVTELSQVLIQLKEEQDHFRGRENIHRQTIQSTYRRIFWISLFEVVVILVVSAIQVYLLTSFLEVKSYI